MSEKENHDERLDGIELFSDLTPDDLRQIESKINWRRFAAEEQVFDQEHKGREVFFVTRGSVRILAYTQTRREVPLADVQVGDYFGELAAIDGLGRSARVVASMESVIGVMQGLDFIEIMNRFPKVAVRVVKRFAAMIRKLDARVTNLSTLSESQRVMVELVRIATPDPRRTGAWLINSLPKHHEIASWAGTTRELVAQTIGELAREGVVERRTMGLVIKDWNRLQLMSKA